jgi:glutamate racemase
MIGVFDSGLGGLTVLRRFIDLMPQYDYLYLGDNARAPYGARSQDEIFQFTLEGVRFLFGQGCPLVILACNTASAGALRRIQREVLPHEFPDRRVLGVIVPTVEQVTSGATERVAVLATQATIASGAYVHEIQKRNPRVVVTQRACPTLVPMIERGASENELLAEVSACLAGLPKDLDAILLGCTHFELVRPLFELVLMGTPVLGQSAMVAASLTDYLARHPEIESLLTKTHERRFLSTGDPDVVSRVGSRFFGSEIRFEQISLTTSDPPSIMSPILGNHP